MIDRGAPAPRARVSPLEAIVALVRPRKRAFVAREDRPAHGARALLVVALFVLTFSGLVHELRMYDEPREAEIARAMMREGHLAVPMLGQRPFLEKPPLFSATVALAWRA